MSFNLSLQARPNRPPQRYLPVVNPDIEAALRTGADPGLVRDGRAVTAVIGQRDEQPSAALLASGPILPLHKAPPRSPEARPARGACGARGQRLGSRRLDPPPDAGPRVIAFERLSKVEYAVEVLDLVRGLANQEPDVNQHVHDTADVGRVFDAPVGQDGARRQSELLQRKIAAGPRQIGTRDMASNARLALPVLQRREHEQIRALVISAVQRANPLKDRLRQFEVVHQVTSLSLTPVPARPVTAPPADPRRAGTPLSTPAPPPRWSGARLRSPTPPAPRPSSRRCSASRPRAFRGW